RLLVAHVREATTGEQAASSRLRVRRWPWSPAERVGRAFDRFAGACDVAAERVFVSRLDSRIGQTAQAELHRIGVQRERELVGEALDGEHVRDLSGRAQVRQRQRRFPQPMYDD